MEQEHFLSGYCRAADQTRMVAVIIENGKLLDVDCCYEHCSHAADCTVARQIRELTSP